MEHGSNGMSSAAHPSHTVLVSSRAVLCDENVNLQVSPATITISSQTGTIVKVEPVVRPRSSFPEATVYVDYTPHILLPGLVDAHVHLNEPGRTEWEGFETGTKAAASGGVTTVIDMPLNAIPPTTTVAGMREKVAAAKGKCWVDIGFYGGIIPGNSSELLPLIEEGVRGFKGFLIESGVDEFPAVSMEDVALAMQTLKDAPTTLMFHAEMVPPVITSHNSESQAASQEPLGPLTSYSNFLSSRPPSFETHAISQVIANAHLAPNLHLHIVHLSAMEAVPLLRDARDKGINITAETCFHYLALEAEQVETGDTRHKCCPPIRGSVNRDGLWTELLRDNSVIQTIVSDHSPCTPELKLLPSHLDPKDSTSDTVKLVNGDVIAREEAEKREKGDFFASWGGIASVGLGLPILWTEAQTRKSTSSPSVSILDIVRLCAVNTAKQVGLSHVKGALRPGLDADICVFDDESSFVVGREQLLFRNKVSPYQGKTMKGMVKATWVRGQKVFERGAGSAGDGLFGAPLGRLILEKREK